MAEKVEQDAEKRIEKEKALQRAKKIEKRKIPTAQDEANEMTDFMKASEKAKKLLKPAWFLKKKDKKNKK